MKQDQGSKAPSGHTSFYICLPFYQVYLCILSFAPCTFLPSWPYIIPYPKQFTYWTYHLLHLPFYPVHLSPKFTNWTYHSLHLDQNIIIVKTLKKWSKLVKIVKKWQNVKKNVKMVKNCQNGQNNNIDQLKDLADLITKSAVSDQIR